MPLHTLRADIDYAHVEAHDSLWHHRHQDWIFKGEIMEHDPQRVTVKHRNSKMALHLVVLAVVAKGEIECFNQSALNSASSSKADQGSGEGRV